MNYTMQKLLEMSPIQVLHDHLANLRAARVAARERIAVLEEELKNAREADLQNEKRELELKVAIHDLTVTKTKEDFRNAHSC